MIVCYREYATDVNILVSKQAISSIGNVALRLPELAHTCVKKLLSLLSYNISCVTSNVLVCLTSECLFRDDLHLGATAYNMVLHMCRITGIGCVCFDLVLAHVLGNRIGRYYNITMN